MTVEPSKKIHISEMPFNERPPKQLDARNNTCLNLIKRLQAQDASRKSQQILASHIAAKDS